MKTLLYFKNRGVHYRHKDFIPECDRWAIPNNGDPCYLKPITIVCSCAISGWLEYYLVDRKLQHMHSGEHENIIAM